MWASPCQLILYALNGSFLNLSFSWSGVLEDYHQSVTEIVDFFIFENYNLTRDDYPEHTRYSTAKDEIIQSECGHGAKQTHLRGGHNVDRHVIKVLSVTDHQAHSTQSVAETPSSSSPKTTGAGKVVRKKKPLFPISPKCQHTQLVRKTVCRFLNYKQNPEENNCLLSSHPTTASLEKQVTLSRRHLHSLVYDLQFKIAQKWKPAKRSSSDAKDQMCHILHTTEY